MASSDPDGLTESARANRSFWDGYSPEYQSMHAEALGGEPAWGLWRTPDTTLGILGDVAGLDILELGCGGAQFGIQLAARGARVTGLDNSAVQLDHARTLQAAAGLSFPLVHAAAEQLPFADASFDLVFNDFGAATFADPYPMVPEVARVLRTGGRFAFSHGSPLDWVCYDEAADGWGTTLQRPYFGMHRDVDGDGTVVFNLTHGEWIRLFVESGLVVERLIEWQPDPAATSSYRDEATRDWARKWPLEEIWVVRKP
jgi:SAM-dependent methyltransferase